MLFVNPIVRVSVMKKKICAIATTEATMCSFIIPSMEYFLDKGYEVTLVCSMTEDFIKRNSPKFHCVNMPMKRGISLSDILILPCKFWRLFRKHRFDYVQYATTNASFYACLPAKLTKIKTRVYCQWGLLYVGYHGVARYLFKWVEKFLCSCATHVTVASNKNLEYAVQEGLMPRSKSSVVGDGGTVGVDLSIYDISKREELMNLVLDEYPVMSGKLIYGYVGRIETDKGISELLSAFLGLDNAESILLLIGPFDELRCNINPKLIERAKASRRVIFHGFTKEVHKYMSAIDVLVHPTYREGFSMVIQQAMAMGCAIITTDIPGPSEVIENGVSGILVKDHSVDDLTQAMSLLGRDYNLRKSFSSAGLDRVRKLFNRQRMLDLTYYDRIRMMNEK